jgi:hypothetical protein
MRAKEFIREDVISPSDDPSIMSFWHGGDLNDTSMRPQKKGRFEYGAGLYLITRYDVAAKYAKGSRKLYMVNVHKGTEIKSIDLDPEIAKQFVNSVVRPAKRKEILGVIAANIERVGRLKADTFNNIILNYEGVGPKDTVTLSRFLVDNGADYELIGNPFGWGDATMMVLYNTNKIADITRVSPKDKITEFDLPRKF